MVNFLKKTNKSEKYPGFELFIFWSRVSYIIH